MGSPTRTISVPKLKLFDEDRELRMDIKEEVVGHELEQRNGKPKFVSQILRYDSSKKDHQKFIKTTSSKIPVETKGHRTENIGSEVSKESYYKVSKDISQSCGSGLRRCKWADVSGPTSSWPKKNFFFFFGLRWTVSRRAAAKQSTRKNK